jgi:hypothetical protein
VTARFRESDDAVVVSASPTGTTQVFPRPKEGGFDRFQHLLGREPTTGLLARYGDIYPPSCLVTQPLQILARRSTLPIVSAFRTDREDLTGDVFALLSSSR